MTNPVVSARVSRTRFVTPLATHRRPHRLERRPNDPPRAHSPITPAMGSRIARRRSEQTTTYARIDHLRAKEPSRHERTAHARKNPSRPRWKAETRVGGGNDRPPTRERTSYARNDHPRAKQPSRHERTTHARINPLRPRWEVESRVGGGKEGPATRERTSYARDDHLRAERPRSSTSFHCSDCAERARACALCAILG